MFRLLFAVLMMAGDAEPPDEGGGRRRQGGGGGRHCTHCCSPLRGQPEHATFCMGACVSLFQDLWPPGMPCKKREHQQAGYQGAVLKQNAEMSGALQRFLRYLASKGIQWPPLPTTRRPRGAPAPAQRRRRRTAQPAEAVVQAGVQDEEDSDDGEAANAAEPGGRYYVPAAVDPALQQPLFQQNATVPARRPIDDQQPNARNPRARVIPPDPVAVNRSPEPRQPLQHAQNQPVDQQDILDIVFGPRAVSAAQPQVTPAFPQPVQRAAAQQAATRIAAAAAAPGNRYIPTATTQSPAPSPVYAAGFGPASGSGLLPSAVLPVLESSTRHVSAVLQQQGVPRAAVIAQNTLSRAFVEGVEQSRLAGLMAASQSEDNIDLHNDDMSGLDVALHMLTQLVRSDRDHPSRALEKLRRLQEICSELTVDLELRGSLRPDGARLFDSCVRRRLDRLGFLRDLSSALHRLHDAYGRSQNNVDQGPSEAAPAEDDLSEQIDFTEDARGAMSADEAEASIRRLRMFRFDGAGNPVTPDSYIVGLPRNDDDMPDCVICQYGFEPGQPLVVLPCCDQRNYLHVVCLSSHLQAGRQFSRRCPICRTVLSEMLELADVQREERREARQAQIAEDRRIREEQDEAFRQAEAQDREMQEARDRAQALAGSVPSAPVRLPTQTGSPARESQSAVAPSPARIMPGSPAEAELPSEPPPAQLRELRMQFINRRLQQTPMAPVAGQQQQMSPPSGVAVAEQLQQPPTSQHSEGIVPISSLLN